MYVHTRPYYLILNALSLLKHAYRVPGTRPVRAAILLRAPNNKVIRFGTQGIGISMKVIRLEILLVIELGSSGIQFRE